MSEANKQQVGGRHYKTSLEHWDWMLQLDMGVDYLIGCATKYVARWRHKNGLQDLEKALHYVNKLLENKHLLPSTIVQPPWLPTSRKDLNLQFTAANKLTAQEANFCEFMSMRTVGGVYCARDILVALIEQLDQAQPVPLTDSNKHAERAEEPYVSIEEQLRADENCPECGGGPCRRMPRHSDPPGSF